MIFSKKKPLKQPSLDLIVGEKGKAQDQTEYDHAMVLLVAVGGVVPNLFDVRAFFKSKSLVTEFETVMSQYIKIIGPLARSLWSLESPHSNTSDIFVHWLAIGASVKEIFSTDSVESQTKL